MTRDVGNYHTREEEHSIHSSRQDQPAEKDDYGILYPFDPNYPDLFDALDGKAVVETDDVKQRRLDGQSSAEEQWQFFDARAKCYCIRLSYILPYFFHQ